MSIQICALLAVIVICITVLIINIVANYPEWCSYYEYKNKAKDYDNLQKQYNNDIKELLETVDNLQKFLNKDTKRAYELLQVILEIKMWLKEKNTIQTLEGIKSVLTNNRL